MIFSNRHMFKNNENFITMRRWRYNIVVHRAYFSKAMLYLLLNPSSGMNNEMLKVDFTTTVAVHHIDNRKIVIKRYNIKNFWHGIKRGISRSRAIKCWRNSHRLLSLDIPTAPPIAMIEVRFGPFRRECYYIYEYLAGTMASDFFIRDNINQPLFPDSANKIMKLIAKLLAANISHGDLKATNFIINDEDIYFIDLDAMKTHRAPWVFRQKRLKEIKRFLANWDDDEVIRNYFLALSREMFPHIPH